MKKTAILIGFGGMGRRYYEALKQANFNIIAICEKNISKLDELQFPKNIILTDEYKKIQNLDSDLLCVASNTKSRLNIIKDFASNSKTKKIITEKPLATSIASSREILKVVKKYKKRLIVNTHRTYSPNFFMIEKMLKQNNENPTSIYINSPSAGLGNMGSIFFDLAKFFFKSKAKSLISWIDQSKTQNPRGKKFKDPGGYGIINFNGGRKLFFDLSENTGLPYTILIKSKNFEFLIDEINNKFQYRKRPKKFYSKPLYYYLFKSDYKTLKIKHKFDVIKMTTFTIKEIFKKKFDYKNLDNSIDVIEYIVASHISYKTKRLIKLPLQKKYHKFEINFA